MGWRGMAYRHLNINNTQMKVQLFKQLKFYNLPQNRLLWSREITFLEQLKITAKQIPSVDITNNNVLVFIQNILI